MSDTPFMGGPGHGPIVDCHFHIIDPFRFSLTPGVGYHPRPDEYGTVGQALTCFAEHGVSHGVAVQPSGYGYDNAALLEAIACSAGRLKGIAVVPPESSRAELAELAAGGIVGLRFNLIDFDSAGLHHRRIEGLIEEAAALGWLVDLQCSSTELLTLLPLIRRLPVAVLIDHLGRPDVRLGIGDPGFQALLGLSEHERVFVKLSGPFRQSLQGYPYDDLTVHVHRLLEAYTPQRCLWGSDWPFINLGGLPRPSYQQTLDWLEAVIPDTPQRRVVLWETPQLLFGFPPLPGS
jgi:predicted TIM-barrel fold metal-dependent hydrolase